MVQCAGQRVLTVQKDSSFEHNVNIYIFDDKVEADYAIVADEKWHRLVKANFVTKSIYDYVLLSSS